MDNKTVIKDFTTLSRYTILWNIHFFKLHQMNKRNGKLSAHVLKKMWR